MHIQQVLFLIFISVASLSGHDRDSLLQVLNSDPDLEAEIKALHELTGIYVRSDLDSARLFALRAYDLTLDKVDSLHGQSITNLSGTYINRRELAEAKALLLTSLDFHRSRQDYRMLGITYRNIAAVAEQQLEPDSILHYIDLCMDVLSEHPDSTTYGDALYSKSFAYQSKGYYELAVQAILEATRIFEAMGKDFQLAFMHHMLATNNSHMEKHEEAIEWNKKCISGWEGMNYKVALVHAYNNVGGDYKGLDSLDTAIWWHRKANILCKEVGDEYVQMLSAFNLADLYEEVGEPDSARYYLQEAEPLASEMDVPFIKGGCQMIRARMSIASGQRSIARGQLRQAGSVIALQEDPREKLLALEQLAELYEQVGSTNSALSTWKEAEMLEDSLYTLDKEARFEESNIIYETEKKDAAIKLLNKQTELDATRKRALGGGLGMLFLLSGGIIYGQVQRRKRIQETAAKEKQIEIEKRKSAEQELEFKKKELTSKALQLARKNEFLQQLESEVSDLKSSVDNTISKTTDRISRMIQMDASDDAEWEQFGREFSSVHQDFLDRLKEQHGKFSKSEMRLIALLKMNLSSKDIANTLRISDEGIKKARYRLRKKLGIDSDIDLQGYILGF